MLLLHLCLGVLAKFMPPAFWLVYAGTVILGTVQVVATRDKDHCAAKYALYLMGMEILYRMSGGGIFWELGKYACIWLFICGMMVRGRQSRIGPFLLYLVLLLPAIALTSSDSGFNAYRRMVMFNLSGPISLAVSGMYFYQRKIDEDQLWSIQRCAILPAFSVLALLFLGPSVSDVEINAESNFSLSGGFGPNQVSTALGYFLLLLFFAMWNRRVLTWNIWTDYLLAGLVAYRALLTFSRGGLFAVVIAVGVSFLGLLVLSRDFRSRFGKYSMILCLAAVAASGIFYIANKATGNWVLYRYQGLDSSEVEHGENLREGSYLTGRENLAAAELDIFLDNWVTGVGLGMSVELRRFHSEVSTHSEPSRLMAEHGILGLFALCLLLVVFPADRLLKDRNMLSQQFFLLFFVLGINTMLHAAMRMAMPGVVTGFAFALVRPKTVKKLK